MVDLIIKNARELVTLAGAGPRRGQAMADLGIISGGAVAMSAGRIVRCGATPEVLDLAGPHTRIVDASDRLVMPGFVDCHTHLVFAADRAAEFELRLQGATYLDILASGGGILSTVHATRSASQADLIDQAGRRLARMLAYGTTTVEAKSGYGLEHAAELRILAATATLGKVQPATVVPTFLAAHAVPPEFGGRADAYVDLIVDDMLPAVARWRQEAETLDLLRSSLNERQGNAATSSLAETQRGERLPFFCDVFCDQGAFSLEQSRRVLQAAKALGLGLKIHADEFAPLGGARLAAELRAVSAEHLAVTPHEDMEAMAAAGVIAVLLPGTTFGLASNHYADARAMIGYGLAVALGTDLNPGTCYCESMPFMLALACRYLKMTPAEAICAATINAAYASGVGHLTGSLQPGKLADILIVDVPDYRHLPYRFGGNPVATVFKSGQEVAHGIA